MTSASGDGKQATLQLYVMPTVHVPEGCCVVCLARSADGAAEEQLTELARTETSTKRDPFFKRSLDLWDEASGKGGSIPLVFRVVQPGQSRTIAACSIASDDLRKFGLGMTKEGATMSLPLRGATSRTAWS